jgi:hypothetical protein
MDWPIDPVTVKGAGFYILRYQNVLCVRLMYEFSIVLYSLYISTLLNSSRILLVMITITYIENNVTLICI